jgi:hypothetical protein
MKLFYYSSIILLLCSCGSIEPTAPEIIVKTVPIIIQPASTVVVPIKINLTPYFKDTDKSIPKKFTGKEENCEDVSFSYFFQRDPIVFKGSGNSILFDVDGRYSLNINYCAKCTDLFSAQPHCVTPRLYVSCGNNGEPMRKVEVGYTTTIKLTPDFKLKANTNLRKFETIDPCEISVFKYDATALLKKEVTKVLKGLEDDIDKQIGSVDLKSEAEKSWKILAEPISLGKYGFFNANPTKIGFDNLKFTGNNATADLSLSLNPKLTTNSQNTKAIALPKLSDVPESNGFNITLDVIATYDSLSKIMTSELKGKEIELKGKKVMFESIEFFGASNQQVSLKIGFSGTKKGTLFLLGTPTFNQENQIVSFPDLSFDLNTKSALLKSAKWLFNDKITDALRTSSIIDLKPHLTTLKQLVEKQLNTAVQPGIFLKGKIKELKMQGIYPNNDTLILRINSTGLLSLEM